MPSIKFFLYLPFFIKIFNLTSNKTAVAADSASSLYMMDESAFAQQRTSAAPTPSAAAAANANQTSCPLDMHYLSVEMYGYLFVVCPLAFVGILLNLISLKCFLDKSFNSVTFKYLRLITLTDFFICVIIIPYCVLFYTQPFNKYDLYGRNLYLAFLYMPGANVAINVAMLLNLLVTIER